MKSIKKILISTVLFSFLVFCIASLMLSNPLYDKNLTKDIYSKRPWVDLSSNPTGINRITSEWTFAWKDFIVSPKNFKSDVYGTLPGSWRNIPGSSRFGWASWGLTVSGLEQNRIYAIRIGQTLSACKIFINGEEALSVGVPGTSAEEEKPEWGSVICRFKASKAGTASIILHISNFHDRTGGSISSIVIGDAELLYHMEDRQRLTEGLLFGILGIMGAFFLSLYVLRPQERQFLWFSLLCIVAGVRALCYDGFTLLYLIPALPWTVFFRIGYVTFPLAIVLFVHFLRSVFPELVYFKHAHFFLSPFYAYILTIAFLPESVITYLLAPMQILSLLIVG